MPPCRSQEKEIDDYELGDCLEFRVYDYDLGSANDLLGRALLPCNAFDREGGCPRPTHARHACARARPGWEQPPTGRRR